MIFLTATLSWPGGTDWLIAIFCTVPFFWNVVVFAIIFAFCLLPSVRATTQVVTTSPQLLIYKSLFYNLKAGVISLQPHKNNEFFKELTTPILYT
jgi:hypothetical protein